MKYLCCYLKNNGISLYNSKEEFKGFGDTLGI
jgi:hypothetical protein